MGRLFCTVHCLIRSLVFNICWVFYSFSGFKVASRSLLEISLFCLLCHVMFWSVIIYVFNTIYDNMIFPDLFWSVLICSGLFWSVKICSDLFWSVPIYPDLFLYVPIHSDLFRFVPIWSVPNSLSVPMCFTLFQSFLIYILRSVSIRSDYFQLSLICFDLL